MYCAIFVEKFINVCRECRHLLMTCKHCVVCWLAYLMRSGAWSAVKARHLAAPGWPMGLLLHL